MMKNRLLTATAVVGLFGFAACGGETVEDDAMTTQEVVTEPTTETVEVQVPAVDSQLVETTVDVDTMVQRDTVNLDEEGDGL